MASTAHSQKKFDRLLILGMVSGPVIYTVYFLVVYSLVEVACKSGFAAIEILGFGLVPASVVLLTILAAVSIVIGGYISYRGWRRSKENDERRQDAYSHFMAAAGVGLNLYFALVTLATAALPVLLQAECASI